MLATIEEVQSAMEGTARHSTALSYIDYFLPATSLKGLKFMGDVLLAQSAKG
jgi:hypothetical protein